MDVSGRSKQCKVCKKTLPVSAFYHKRKRPMAVCKSCYSTQRAYAYRRKQLEDGIRPDWDWASALSKHLKIKEARAGNTCDALDAELLRCLYGMQKQRCGLSGLTMLVPIEPENNSGIDTWRAELASELEARSIDAVKLDATRGFEPGNILLCCHMYSHLYRYCGSPGEFTRAADALCDHRIIVNDRTTIAVVREARRQQRLDAAKHKREIKWGE